MEEMKRPVHRAAAQPGLGSGIAVAREKDHLIDMRRDPHCVDRKFDVDVALDLAPASLIDEFFGCFGNYGEAVVVQPIEERLERRMFVILEDGRCNRMLAAACRVSETRLTNACNQSQSQVTLPWCKGSLRR